MKQSANESVVHDWVTTLPFTQQALLMLALRGPDGSPKHSSAKRMLYYLRGIILKPAYPNFNGGLDGFMTTDYSFFNSDGDKFFSDTDSYPMHFLMHLFHAAEVVGYNYPEQTEKELEIKTYWLHFYEYACKCFHMSPESKEQLFKRLFY